MIYSMNNPYSGQISLGDFKELSCHLDPSKERLMNWHLQVRRVPQGLISGPAPSRLLESVLLSQ